MPGEQLDPVIARMEGDDSDYLGMLDRDVAALRSAAGEIESLLAGLDIGAGLASSLSGGDLASINTDELAQGLGEQMAGVGSALAQDLGTELGQGLAAAGVDGGQALADGVAEGASALGDGIANDLGEKLAEPLQNAGAEAGGALQDGMLSGVSNLGAQVENRVSAGLDSLQGAAGAAGATAGFALTGGLQAGLLSLSARVAATGGAIVAAMTATGAAGGEALSAGIDSGATGSAGAVAQHVADAVQAGLDSSLIQAGMSGGDALATGISYGAEQSSDEVAQKIAESMEASLSTSMTQTGMAAGDALAAGIAAAAQTEAGSVAAEFGTALDLPAAEAAREAGAAAGEAYVAGFKAPVTDLNARFKEWQEAQSTTAWVPHVSVQQFLDEIARAEAAEQELAASMAADEEIIQNGIDNFLTLSDQQLRQWMAEVESAASESSSAFIDAYSAINEQLDATTELTMRQAEAMEYLYTEARAEMDALQAEAIAFNSTVKDFSGFTPKSMVTGDTFYTADQMSAMVAGFKNGADGAEGLGSELKTVGASASEAGGELGGMASIISGPWAMGAMMALSVLPMIGSLFSANSVSAGTFTQSIEQDSGAVGDNTAATIQQTLAKSNLNDMASQLGVSQATLIEYAAGESQAQQQVTSAYNAKQSALENASDQEGVHSKAEDDAGNAADRESTALANQKTYLDQVTASVAASITQTRDSNDALLAAEQTTQIYNASVDALGSQMLLNAQQANMQNQATVNYTDRLIEAANAGNAFNLALEASYDKMQLNAQASAQASVGLLNLGANQARANTLLYDSEDAYTEAQQGASAYNTAVESINGSENTFLSAAAGFTIALSGIGTAAKTNGDSLDYNNVKGAQNIEVLTGVASKAIAAADAVYQNEVATQGSVQAYQDANTKLEQEKTAFEQAAEKAGFNKTAVQQLADELFKLPPDVQIDVDTSPAEKGLKTLIEQINGSSATVKIYENTSGDVFNPSSGGSHARAAGGPVQAGVTYTVNEQGAERFTPATDGFITAHSALGSGYGGNGGGGDVHYHFHIDGSLIHQDDLRDVVQQGTLQFQQRNSYTGLQYA